MADHVAKLAMRDSVVPQVVGILKHEGRIILAVLVVFQSKDESEKYGDDK